MFAEDGFLNGEPVSGSFTVDSVRRQRELCLARHFAELDHAVCSRGIASLADVIVHSDAIFDTLERILEAASEARESIAAIAAVAASLCADLRNDFFSCGYLDRLVHAMSISLHSDGLDKDDEVVHALFKCLGICLARLQPSLVNDLSSTLNTTKPLRQSRIAHVRSFANEVVSYVLRSCPRSALLNAGVQKALQECNHGETQRHASAALLAEAAKGAAGSLHSRTASRVLGSLFDPAGALHIVQDEETMMGNDLEVACFQAAKEAIEVLALHVQGDKAEPLWACLLAPAQRFLQSEHPEPLRLARSLDLIAKATMENKGSMVHSFDVLLQLAEDVSERLNAHPEFSSSQELVESALELIRSLAVALASLRKGTAAAYNLANAARKSDWEGIVQAAPPASLVPFVYALTPLGDEALASFASKLMPALAKGMMQSAERASCTFAGANVVENLDVDRELPSGSGDACSAALRLITRWRRECSTEDDTSDCEAFAAMRLINTMARAQNQNEFAVINLDSDALQMVSAACERASKRLTTASSSTEQLGVVIVQCRRAEAAISWKLHSRTAIARMAENAVDFFVRSTAHPSSIWLLLAASENVQVAVNSDQDQHVFSAEYFRLVLLPALQQYMQSSSSCIRLAAHTIAASADAGTLYKLDPSADDETEPPERCDVFAHLYKSANVPRVDVLSHSRRVTTLMTAVSRVCSTRRLYNGYAPPLAYALLGELRNRFALLYPPIVKALAALTQSYEGVQDVLLDAINAVQADMLDASTYQKTDAHSKRRDQSSGLENAIKEAQSEAAEDECDASARLTRLLNVLHSAGSVAEERITELVDHFLHFVDFYMQSETSSKRTRSALHVWLSLLKEVHGGRAVKATERGKALHWRLIRLLESPDWKTQQLAIECLVQWKLSYLNAYASMIRKLASPNDIREAMTTLCLAPNVQTQDSGGVAIRQEHRGELIPLITRLLLPRLLLHSSGKGAERRAVSSAATLTYLAHLPSRELETLVSLLIERVRSIVLDNAVLIVITSAGDEAYVPEDAVDKLDVASASSLPPKQKVGVLKTANEALTTMGEAIAPYLQFFLAVSTVFLQATIESNQQNERQAVRRSASAFLNKCIRSFPSLRYHRCADRLLGNVVEPLCTTLADDAASGTDAIPCVLSLLEPLADNKELGSMISARQPVLDAVIGIIGNIKASRHARESALSIVESLHNCNFLPRAVVPRLVEQLRSALEYATQRKQSTQCEAELAILESVGKWVIDRDAELARSCALAVLPLATPRKRKIKALPGGSQATILTRAIDALTSLLPSALHAPDSRHSATSSDGVESDVVDAMELLIASGCPRNIRERVVVLVKQCKRIVDAEAAQVLERLNAYVAGCAVDEYDFNTRIAAYGEIDAAVFRRLEKRSTKLIVQQALHDLHCADLALRQASLRSLNALLKACSHDDASDTLAVVRGVVYPRARLALTSEREHVRSEHLTLLRDATLMLPEQIEELTPLASSDPEQDFFCNVAHIQANRRSRALRSLRSACEQQALTSMAVLEVGEPLVRACLVDNSPDVAETANQTLSSLCTGVGNGAYCELLRKYSRLLRKTNEFGSGSSKLTEKVLCRVLAQLVDARPNDARDVVRSDVLQAVSDQVVVQSPGRPDGTTIRPQAVLAVIKALKALDGSEVRFQLQQHLGRAAEKLRSREQKARENARNALVLAAGELDTSQLRSLVSLLRAVLQRGFQLHVLGYTVHAMLQRVIGSSTDIEGALDGLVADVAPVLVDDIFGQAGEEKEVDAIASKAVETKKCKAYEGFELLARGVTLPAKLSVLMGTVHSQLTSAKSHEARSKLSAVLQRISRGMLRNPTFDSESLLMFCYATSNDALIHEERSKSSSVFDAQKSSLPKMQSAAEQHCPRYERASKLREAAGTPLDLSKLMRSFTSVSKSDHDQDEDDGDAGSSEESILNSDLLLAFATNLLRAHLKKHLAVDGSKLSTGVECAGGSERLSGLLPLLQRILTSTSNSEAVDDALRCFTHLLPLGLRSVSNKAEELAEQVLAVLQREPSMTTTTAHEGCKALSTLLRECDDNQAKTLLPRERAQFIVQSALADLEDPQAKTTTFTLLRAVLSRKPLLPEVYDLMERVAGVMVRSQDDNIREHCGKALVQFLLTFPMGKKRLRSHLESLCANLSFEHPSGRSAALQCLLRVAQSFPQKTLTAHADFIFLPVVARLASDEDSSCRSLACDLIQAILLNVHNSERDRLAQWPISWLSSSEAKLRHAGSQSLTLVLQTVPKAVKSQVEAISRAIEVTLHDAAIQSEQGEDAQGGWQPLYSTLLLLEKLRELEYFSGEAATLWRSVLVLSDYPHVWVRKSCVRLLLQHVGNKDICDNAELFAISKAVCKQLAATNRDAPIDGEHAHAVQRALDYVAQRCAERSESNERRKVNDSASSPQRILKWLAKRLGTVSTSAASEQARLAAVRWVGSSAHSLAHVHRQCSESRQRRENEDDEEDGTFTALEGVSIALFKSTDSETKNVPESVRIAGSESLEQLKEALGAREFATVLTKARERVHGKRARKRTARAIDAVADPAKHARKKRAITKVGQQVGAEGSSRKHKRRSLTTIQDADR